VVAACGIDLAVTITFLALYIYLDILVQHASNAAVMDWGSFVFLKLARRGAISESEVRPKLEALLAYNVSIFGSHEEASMAGCVRTEYDDVLVTQAGFHTDAGRLEEAESVLKQVARPHHSELSAAVGDSDEALLRRLGFETIWSEAPEWTAILPHLAQLMKNTCDTRGLMTDWKMSASFTGGLDTGLLRLFGEIARLFSRRGRLPDARALREILHQHCEQSLGDGHYMTKEFEPDGLPPLVSSKLEPVELVASSLQGPLESITLSRSVLEKTPEETIPMSEIRG